jgi:HK97 family phage major capsid protein
MRTAAQLLSEIKELQSRERQGLDVTDELRVMGDELARRGFLSGEAFVDAGNAIRGGSRFAGPDADPSLVKHLAKGGSIGPGGEFRHARGGPAGQIGGHASSGSLLHGMKALAQGTPSAGGYLVPQDVSEQVLGLIRARSAVMGMGPKVVRVEGSELVLNAFSTGSSAAYVAEGARIPVSEPTFSQAVILRPKLLAALVPASNRLPEIEDQLKAEIAEVIALRRDLSFLQGLGTSEPLGIRNQAGLTPGPNLGANGRTPTFDDLKAVVAALRGANAPFQKPGWIFHPRLLSTLETVKDADGRYLADAGLLSFDATGGGGKLLGFPFRTTGQIPVNLTRGTSNDATYIVFGSDWQDAWVGEDQRLEIELSREATYSTDGTTWASAFQQNQTLFRALESHDLGLARPSHFVVVEGVRP